MKNLFFNLTMAIVLTLSFNALACDCDKKGGAKCEKGKECGCDKKGGKSCEGDQKTK